MERLIVPVAAGLGLLLFVSCQEILPDAFQEEEFSLGPLDSEARTILLGDTLAVPVSASVSDTLDSLIADSVLMYSLQVNWRIGMPGDTAYVALNLAEGTMGEGTLVFFYDDIVSMAVMDDGGTEIEVSQDVFPLETFAFAPEIRTRLGYELSAGEGYLIRFVASTRSFHVVILEEE